jgi:hypothetical protein
MMAALDSDTPPLVLDLRGSAMIAETGPIVAPKWAEHDFLHDAVVTGQRIVQS